MIKPIILLCVIIILSGSWVFGQEPKAFPSSETASGTINVPALVSFDIVVSGREALNFSSWSDFTDPKVLNGFFDISVKASVPWMITVLSTTPYFNSIGNASQDMPVSLMKIKSLLSNSFVPVSTTSQVILQNTNTNLENHFAIDAKMDAPWNYRGGNYSLNLVFSITAQ